MAVLCVEPWWIIFSNLKGAYLYVHMAYRSTCMDTEEK